MNALLRSGLSYGLDAVRLDAAIIEAQVPRRAAYRGLESTDVLGPQEAFRRAVLLKVLRDTPLSTGLAATRQAALAEIERHREAFESGDDHALASARSEMIRVVAGFNFSNIEDSQTWRVYRTVASAVTTKTSTDPELLEALRFGELSLISGYAQFFEELALLFRLRLKPHLTMNEFAVSAFALNEGLANRTTTSYRLNDIAVADEAGVERLWTLLAIGFEALVNRFFDAESK